MSSVEKQLEEINQLSKSIDRRLTILETRLNGMPERFRLLEIEQSVQKTKVSIIHVITSSIIGFITTLITIYLKRD